MASYRLFREPNIYMLNDGIDFDKSSKTVSFIPSREEDVDTSFYQNLTNIDPILGGVDVWSIFKRKRGMRGDGNPLLYAMNHEEGWIFATKRDEELIYRQFNRIAQHFVDTYHSDVTIVVPSGNALNLRIAKNIDAKTLDAVLIEGIVRPMTTEEVDDIVTSFGSEFRQIYPTAYEFNKALDMLYDSLDKMEKERHDYFTRHFIKNAKLRDAVDISLKLTDDTYAKCAKKITDWNVLIINDSISKGEATKYTLKTIKDTYAPRSITILTLISKQ